MLNPEPYTLNPTPGSLEELAIFNAGEGSAVYFLGAAKEVFGIFKTTDRLVPREIGSYRVRVEGPNLGLMTAASLKVLLSPPTEGP